MTTFKARFVFPVASPPLRDAYVTFRDGLLEAISTEAPKNAEVEDLGDVILLPGLINTHCHLEFSSQKRPFGQPGMPLPTWIREVIGQRPTEERIDAAVRKGLAASLAAGVTTIADITRHASSEYVANGASAIGQRPRLLLLQEAIGFSNARAATATVAATDDYAELAKLSEQHPNVQSGLSPHAPYTASLTLVKNLVALASENSVPVAMHLAESPEELELLSAGRGPFRDLLDEREMWCEATVPPGTKPLAYLEVLAQAKRSLVIHGNYLDEEELAFLAQHRETMSLVYCPRTHHYFRHERYPLVKAVDLGVRVVLGTDGCGSNPDLSLLSDMRHVAKKFPEVSPQQVLEMGTYSAAKALGLAGSVGSLQPGLSADLIALPTDAETPDDALKDLLSGEKQATQVWTAGVPVLS